MGNIGIKQYYNYPGSFREEGSTSQISVQNKKNKIQTEHYKFISMKKYILRSSDYGYGKNKQTEI